MFTDSMLALHSSKMTGRKGWMATMMEDKESTASHNCTDRYTLTDLIMDIISLLAHSEESTERFLHITSQTLW